MKIVYMATSSQDRALREMVLTGCRNDALLMLVDDFYQDLR